MNIKISYKKLKRDIKVECVKRELHYDDLSQMTGYSVSSIGRFMMKKPQGDRDDSNNVAAALIIALKLDQKECYKSLLTQITEERKV